MTILIEAKNLTKSFKGRTVLDKINFTVTEGKIFGYLGPNGAGKTTTIRLILGLLRPSSGEALVWGKPLGDSPRAEEKSRCRARNARTLRTSFGTRQPDLFRPSLRRRGLRAKN